MEVEAVGPGDNRLPAVKALYKRHAAVLGFMPKGAFDSRAETGTLLVAMEQSELRGYVLYDLPRRQITIRHLCVAESVRGTGVAKALVDQVIRRHPERRGISLSCRDDFPAAGLWPRLDFEPLDKVRGRSREGHLLTRWWLDFNHPTLFTQERDAPGPVATAALDTDVFLDLVSPQGRQAAQESEPLLEDWVSERADLFITKEISLEVQDETRLKSTAFRRRDAQMAVWKPIAERLKAARSGRPGGQLSDHDESDVRHIARAAAVGASYFLTRDRQLKRRLAAAASEAGVKVVTPGEFIAEMDSASGYAPVLVEHTTFSICPTTKYTLAELSARFLNYGAGEKRTRFEAELRHIMAGRAGAGVWVVADDHDQPVALYAQRLDAEVLEVPLMRVAGPLAPTISRHVAHIQRERAITICVGDVRVTDPMMTAPLLPALAAEGYQYGDGIWRARPQLGVVHLDDIASSSGLRNGADAVVDAVRAAAGAGGLGPELAAEIERQCSPLKVVGAGIATYLVPIRPAWAAQLFDSILSSGTFFARDPALGMSREHVYYSGANRNLRLPARLVWYVSGDRQRVPGAGTLRAVSSLDEAVIDRPGTLYRRYQHLGVWKRDEVAAAARRGKVLALRFSNTELLDHPVSLDDLRAAYEECGRTPFLQSLSELPEQVFVKLYQRGTDAPH